MENLFAQTDLIEIDSATRAAVRTVPFDKPFLIKVPIEAESVNNIFLIKKHKNKSLDGTVAYYSSSPGGYKIPKIEKNYFWTKKTRGKNYLFISIADEYLFKPSESYFIIPDFRQTDASVINFFDAYYQSTISTGSTQAALLTKAEEHLSKFEGQMRKIYGNKIDFGFMTLDHFINNRKDFDSDTNTLRIDTLQQRYESSKSIANTGLASATTRLSANFPSFDSITSMQLFTGSTINKEATSYISGNNLFKNDLISDLSYLRQTNQLNNLLSGATALTCALCEQADISSNTVKELNKRAANIDSSIKQLNMLQRSLYLLKAKATPKSNVDTGITRINLWLRELEASKDAIVIMAKQRSKIEDIIMDSVFAGRKFTYTQILSGNTYMSFETRNKMLLTPDFGIVTSAITSEGKSLEYGIIPYLGFHINLMAVDKDITFKSYKKHPLQYFSLMVGWSLVNMKKDSAYANFFEKSSLLTGIGFRLNNAFRITAGTQWLFKLGLDANHQETRKLKAMPFIGLSFDLNVKQYLNGFTDLLSGIGKTNPSTPKTNTQ
jgi:hypothetical protein